MGSGVIPALLSTAWHLVLRVPESRPVPLRGLGDIRQEIREDGYRSMVSQSREERE